MELVARDGNPRAFELHPVMSKVANCDFSFSGIKTWLRRTADREEEKFGKKHKHAVIIDVSISITFCISVFLYTEWHEYFNFFVVLNFYFHYITTFHLF